MAAFQDTREQTEQKVLVHLLSEIERNPSFTQRNLAVELGVALGLMNQYLKSCVTKGWVRASQVSANRWKYFVTPEGFREKSHMVANYLARSMTFFRDAKVQCEDALQYCATHGYKNIALAGPGDLADILKLVANGGNVETTVGSDQWQRFDAVVITDVLSPQATFDNVSKVVEARRIVTLPLLHISRGE